MKSTEGSRVREELVSQVLGGVSVAEACRRMGVNPKTAYNWVSQKRKKATPKPIRFVQVAPTSEVQPIELEVGSIKVVIRRGFEPALLREVVELLEGMKQ